MCKSMNLSLFLVKPISAYLTVNMNFLLTALLFLEIFGGFNAEPTGDLNFACSDGEEYHMCKPPCERTCESIRQGIRINCSRPCVAGCFCKTGLVRARDNACVLPSECIRPACQENEEFLECGSPCELNCTNMNTGIFCTKSCRKGCFCKSNFVRDSSGKCVHPGSCRNSNQQCPENEISAECMDFCNSCVKNNYCSTPYCIPGCNCKPGYFRNDYWQCIPERQCLAERYDLHSQCGVNEVYATCVNPCNDCISKGRCEYGSCSPGCDCKPGFFRNLKGICVPDWDCYKQCKENEEYLECGPSCRSTCENYRSLLYHVCKQECVSGCFCKKNFVLGPANTCISVEQCSRERQPVCPPGEQLYPCMPTCRHTCDSYNDPNALCDTSCFKGCFCKGGMIRRKDGVCVHPKDCPAERVPCPAGEVLYQCLPTCRTTCRTLNVSDRMCSTGCSPGCFCQLGSVRDDKGNCVRPEDCSVATCLPGETYYDCIPTCRQTCANLNSSTPCSERCSPGCFCRPGFVRNQDGQCVRPRNCPIVCRANEEFRSCGSECPATCENLNRRPVCTDKCVAGCFCKAGFVLGPGRTCIPTRSCPPGETIPSSPGFQFRRGSDDEETTNETTTLAVTNEPKQQEANATNPTPVEPKTTEKKLPDVTATPQNEAENTSPALAKNSTPKPPTSQASAVNETETTNSVTNATELTTENVAGEIITSLAITTEGAENATLVNITTGP